MPRTKTRATPPVRDGFINLPVSAETRAGLHYLKEVMGVRGQAEVVAVLVKMGVEMDRALRR